VAPASGGGAIGQLDRRGAGLHGLAIANHSKDRRETAPKRGKFVLLAHSCVDDATRAEKPLNRTRAETLEYHQ
jgi:hypothetical protein